MTPSTRLFQGNFTNTDILLADNLVRACKQTKVQRIIYLGGIIPKGYLSSHINSRKEVEQVFTSSSIPTTIIRAGIIINDDGSSYQILKNLVKNLPIMILPKWTKNVTQVISLADVLRVIKSACRRSDNKEKAFDVAINEDVTYLQLLKEIAQHMKKRRIFFMTPFSLPNFSKKLISLIGRSHIDLVSPLVDSLLCDFSKIRSSAEVKTMIKHDSLKEALQMSNKLKGKSWFNSIRRHRVAGRTVRSIQRLPTRADLSSQEIATRYIQWLPYFFKMLIKTKLNPEGEVSFSIIGKSLLTLKQVPEKSDKDRQLFYITGGLLVKRKDYGWLEFRQIENRKHTLVIIHEFEPTLPWYLYINTQAPLHKLVMECFGKSLELDHKGNQKDFSKESYRSIRIKPKAS
ncbi:MAG: epimerase [Bdellovibrionales bacterium]|nr:hypothetical protein [Bdellovibrionales bacterium]NQZ18325.1 epimerase [Bdellovibrionales bacterium]